MGWVIPRGCPKVDMGRQFIRFCARADRQAAWTKHLANGPSNPDAYKFTDKARAKTLHTFPENLAQQVPLDVEFWGKHKDAAQPRFNEWLLQR